MAAIEDLIGSVEEVGREVELLRRALQEIRAELELVIHDHLGRDEPIPSRYPFEEAALALEAQRKAEMTEDCSASAHLEGEDKRLLQQDHQRTLFE